MYFLVCFVLFFAACNAQADLIREDKICKTRNGYYNLAGQCDTYYECREYESVSMVCPDGLNFNPKAVWPNYPCGYPVDVPCLGRSSSQPHNPTAECPRQYGFFASPLAEVNDCGQYRLCAEGRAYDMKCPDGLAFSLATSRCDWPENVPGCNAQDFFGISCPAPEYDSNGYPLVTNVQYDSNCYSFFSCQFGHGRLLSCDPGFAFDPITRRCVDADLVDCDAVDGLSARHSEID